MIADHTTYSIVYEIWEPPEDKGGKLNSYSQLNFPEKSDKIKNENNYHKKIAYSYNNFWKNYRIIFVSDKYLLDFRTEHENF